jgi:ABC-2 type transport system permease protein
MSNIGAVMKKEVRSYLNSPIAYVAALFFLLVCAIWFFFVQQFLARDLASMRSYFSIVPIIFIVLIPALTMRIWAEERKLKTDEILLTLPMRDWQIVIGKYLSIFVLVTVVIILTIPIPVTLNALGDFETGEIVGEYIGTILLGSAGIAIGQFISSVSKNQISAFIFSVLALVFITLVGKLNVLLELPGWLTKVVNFLAMDYHFESFKKGLIDSRDVAYFIILTAFFLFLNMKVLVFRKWK